MNLSTHVLPDRVVTLECRDRRFWLASISLPGCAAFGSVVCVTPDYTTRADALRRAQTAPIGLCWRALADFGRKQTGTPGTLAMLLGKLGWQGGTIHDAIRECEGRAS